MADGWGSHQVELADPTQPPLLARSTVDRCSAQRTDVGWIDAAWASRGQLLRLTPEGGSRIDFDTDGLVWESTGGERPPEAWFLGAEDADGVVAAGPAYFAVVVPALPGARSLRDSGARLGDRDAGLLTAAVGLANWHAVNRHCPRCGSSTAIESGGWVRVCPSDGSHHFPRTDPAVIMLITNPAGDACVLGRQAIWPRGRFSCLAGFVEPGESLEDAVRREVAEESGVIVDEVLYHSSQPWPMPASLMVGFIAVASSPEIALRDNELEEARWFTPQQIVDGLADGSFLASPALSVSYQLLAHWLRQRAGLNLDDMIASSHCR